ncbi:MAG: hypothetical protein HDR01_12560 [Lachnospiraceae bacterium]|nr:hypothetical protein [Lachnospiraceae bacterium]
MTEVKFKNRKLNIQKLLSFGFENANNDYTYHTDLVEGQLNLTVKIDHEEKIYTEVVDNSSGDEYVLHLVASAAGSFVGQVKSEYEALLEEISAKCFDIQIFKSKQAKEVIAYIWNTYGDELEYLWQKFPDNAVVRRKDNRKWYAALLTVSRRKLGFDSDETVEILDLRMITEDIKKEVDGVKILHGYHMNKKHWITICLDGSMSMDEIFQLINKSYILAGK